MVLLLLSHLPQTTGLEEAVSSKASDRLLSCEKRSNESQNPLACEEYTDDANICNRYSDVPVLGSGNGSRGNIIGDCNQEIGEKVDRLWSKGQLGCVFRRGQLTRKKTVTIVSCFIESLRLA